jgi:hypothetical protein
MRRLSRSVEEQLELLFGHKQRSSRLGRLEHMVQELSRSVEEQLGLEHMVQRLSQLGRLGHMVQELFRSVAELLV